MSGLTITIDWLEDSFDCETCGTSYATGARITMYDGRELLLEPRAHCFDGISYSTEDVYKEVLHLLGFNLVEDSRVED